MKELTFTIKDETGIHARPAAMLVKEASKFPCKITIKKEKKEVDAKSIFAVMSLGAKCKEQIIVRTDGEQEEEAIEVLHKLLEENM